MKYAKFSDDFLSYFRLDDNGETLVLTDKRGYTRAVELLPYEERPKGKWLEPFERNGKTYHKCTHCHISSELILFGNFCPNCGADMRKPNCVRCDHFGKDCNKCEKGEEE